MKEGGGGGWSSGGFREATVKPEDNKMAFFKC